MRILVLLWAPFATLAADDARVTRLEQDVRTLQRQVQDLSRQVDQSRLQSSRPAVESGISPPSPLVAAAPAWVDAAKWQRLKSGMGEFEVFAILGTPTSTREVNGVRELFYAVDIGSSAFLAGSVQIRDHKVVEVKIPTLK
jgi:hypothetical protein